MPAASNFVAFSQFLAAYSTLDFTRSPLAGKGTWCLLPTTPSLLPTATKHFDRAVAKNKMQQPFVQWKPDIMMYQGSGKITSLYQGIIINESLI